MITLVGSGDHMGWNARGSNLGQPYFKINALPAVLSL